MTRGICLQGNLPLEGSTSGGRGVCLQWGLHLGGLHPNPPGSGCRPTCQRHRYPHILPGLDLDTWESQVVNPGFVGDANIWFHQIFWKIAWNTFGAQEASATWSAYTSCAVRYFFAHISDVYLKLFLTPLKCGFLSQIEFLRNSQFSITIDISIYLSQIREPFSLGPNIL